MMLFFSPEDDLNKSDKGGGCHDDDDGGASLPLFVVIVQLNFGSETFRIKQDGKETTCRTTTLIEHCPSETMRYLYKKCYHDPSVCDWIDKSTFVRKVIDGWKGLDKFYNRMIRRCDDHLIEGTTTNLGLEPEELGQELGQVLEPSQEPDQISVSLGHGQGPQSFIVRKRMEVVQQQLLQGLKMMGRI
jgi:hypothetical protein